MTLNEKLDNFYTSVIDSATAQSVEIIEEYQTTLKKIYDERKDAATKRSINTYRVETDNILREKNRKLSQETLDVKRKVLERTEELTNKLFADAETKLNAFMKTPEYLEHLKNRIKEAYDFARGDEIIIYINPSDAAHISMLEKETGIKLTVSNRDFIGGIRAVITSRTILIDHSYLTKLSEAKSSFNF